ncbi:MAG TPA: flavin reductase family protein [Euryarchaeota archaeon]|nr:flavin reductase family protein [Euryarchaeota archaeon]
MQEISPKKALSQFGGFPVVIASIGNMDDSNLITLAYVYPMSIDPCMVGVGIGIPRYSHEYFERYPDFALNLVTRELLEAANVCGSKSGRDVDKWDAANLTKAMGVNIQSPHIASARAVFEIQREGSFKTGDHTCFFGKVVSTLVKEDYHYLENMLYWRGKYGEHVHLGDGI